MLYADYWVHSLLEKDPAKRASWSGVSASDWMVGIVWDDFENKRVTPPWLPPRTNMPTTSNFVKWDLKLPTQAVSVEVHTCVYVYVRVCARHTIARRQDHLQR